MSAKKSGKTAEAEAPDLEALARDWSRRKDLSGSDSGYFTLALLNQVWRALYCGQGTAQWRYGHEDVCAAALLATTAVSFVTVSLVLWLAGASLMATAPGG